MLSDSFFSDSVEDVVSTPLDGREHLAGVKRGICMIGMLMIAFALLMCVRLHGKIL